MLAITGILDLAKRDPDMPDEAVDADYLIDELAIVGDVDSVTRKLHDLFDVVSSMSREGSAPC